MPAKKHRPEEIIGKLREAEVVLAQGDLGPDARQLILQEAARGNFCRPPQRSG